MPHMPHMPKPTPTDILAYYERLAPTYDVDRFQNSYGRHLHLQETRILREFLPAQSNIMDLGCGTGRFLELATAGTDLSPAMLEQARTHHPSHDLRLMSGQELPFENDAFDAAFSMHVFMHLDLATIQTLLKELHRVVRVGGHIVVDAPSLSRRRLTRTQPTGWHGATALDPGHLKGLAGPGWRMVADQGVLTLPVHRFPKWLRGPLLPADEALSKSRLRRFSSYRLYKFQRLM
ncbi:MAG: SAM-dependent methyltransferase [Cognaticolwellia sp.]|jgi:SAM-dependent methyltransferase